MKITSEKLDNAINKKLNTSIITQIHDNLENGELCQNSAGFKKVIGAYIRIFNEGDKTIRDLIFNCLLTGIEIGYIIAEDELEVKQLEEICGITKEDLGKE